MSSDLINYLALDVGAARIGVATANSVAKIASPLTFLANGPDVAQEIQQLLDFHDASVIVVGKPLNIEGEETKQTEAIKQFITELKPKLKSGVKLIYADESSTSKLAERQLDAAGKKYQKGDIDALSASYILQRYLDDTAPVDTLIHAKETR